MVATAKLQTFRSFSAQFIASCAKNFVLLTSGVAASTPTVIIPALTGSKDGLRFTDFEASWFASLFPLFDVVGTILSGCSAHAFGRKRSMIISMIPHMVGMALLYFAKSVPMAFIGISLMGFAMGYGESAISTYVSEITEPSFRGMLLAFSSIMVQLGSLIVFALGSLYDWRTVILCIMSMPYITVIIITIVPEAPSWLLMKERKKTAESALQWLRGWVPPQHIAKELAEMEVQVVESKKCRKCDKPISSCTHPAPNLLQKLQEIVKPPNSKVMVVVVMLFCISFFMGASAIRPFIVKILEVYGSQIKPETATVYIGVASVIGKLLSTGVIKIIGKRKVAMISLFGTLLTTVGLAVYAHVRLPPNQTSFNQHGIVNVEPSNIPLILFVLYFLAFNFAMEGIPFISLCEMFPFRNRCACTSLAIAIGQLINFVTTKCYIYLELAATLSGTMWFFSAVCILGLIAVFFFMPESEGVSMQQIEIYFCDENRKWTDVNMKKYVQLREESKDTTSL